MALKGLHPFISFGLAILVWEAAIRCLAIPAYKFPGPLAVAEAMKELALSGRLLASVVASLFRVTWGFYLAACAAIPLGLVLGIYGSARAFLNPIVQFLRPISPLAWIPVALMWLGIGDRSAIFLIFLSSFFPLLVFTMSAVLGIKVTYIRVGLNFGVTGLKRYTKILLPAIMPDIITGLRITLGTAWLVIVAAEMIAVKSGLGYLIIDGRNSMRMDYVVAAMIVIGIIGLVLDWTVSRLEMLPSVRWIHKRR